MSEYFLQFFEKYLIFLLQLWSGKTRHNTILKNKIKNQNKKQQQINKKQQQINQKKFPLLRPLLFNALGTCLFCLMVNAAVVVCYRHRGEVKHEVYV